MMPQNMSRMPVLFVGHGSPMNAIETNDFTRSLMAIAEKIPRPKAILCISAHWLTEGTWITRADKPKTIHDFGGFPKPLFEVQYPAPGSVELADLLRTMVKEPLIQPDENNWGLDHGAWSVLRHMYPAADVPVVQLSIHFKKPGEFHYQLGNQLRPLRDRGVLIVGSGNIVHNLQSIRWDKRAAPFDWAEEFDAWAKARLVERDFTSLCDDYLAVPTGQLAVPTPEHYFPMLYVLGATDANDKLTFEYEEIQNGSISMRTFTFGRQT